jgi:hypothetical protein
VAHAGRHSLSCHLLSNPTDGIDMQPEHTRHFHARRQLGIDDLGDYQSSRSRIVLRPLKQRHGPHKHRRMPAVCIAQQPQAAPEQHAWRRTLTQSRWLMSSNWVTLSTLPATAPRVNLKHT